MSQRTPAYTGVVPPIVTPMDANGEIDTASLERLVDFLVDAGVTGIFALGSSGESAYLTEAQRDTVLDVIVGAVSGRVPVLAGCIETTTHRALDRARSAAARGADALVATAPFYTRTHPSEIDRHFREIAARTELPLLAYDVPVSVHSKLDADQLLALAADGVIAGVKDSSGDDPGFRDLVIGARELPEFSVLTGHEAVVDAMMLMGADGVVPGLGNVDPAGYVRLLQACEKGDWAAAREEQERLIRLFRIVRAVEPGTAGGSTAGVGAFKCALALLGVIDDATPALPMRPFTEVETGRVRAVLEEVGLL
ncbi:dihydrodipicolinate synthase family protein [Nocardiopsis algeriensis]|uniref:4-hydroxy-tetrahydrodipicolinate synthase n=1 Tax=Nocardiopsis algeriensis TaxID=1478215 RepID=A0A841IXF0_9ACTN|nr:dihydrodipicolinate synthase family protein [Nocardiopsis algeriensis]MBB6120851.1 4-hydroxy-tetrahydrodipicolinate synthase [Nocardiopsis algeriensis]